MGQQKISIINDEIDIKLFLYITKKSFLYVLLFLGISFSLAFFYLRYTYPIYSSSATIQISSNDEKVRQILETENDLGQQQNDLTQAKEILSSSVFLSKALSKLPLDISYFYEGRILSYEQYKSSPYIIESKIISPSIYEVPIYLKFFTNQKFELSYTIPGSKKFEKEYKISEKVVLPEIELTVNYTDIDQIEFSNSILDQNSYFFILKNPDNIVSTYLSELSISILNENAKTIKLTVEDRNPTRAYDIVSAIVEDYKIYGVEKKAESANSVLDFIDRQLNVIYDTLYQSEVNLDSFKKAYNLDSSDVSEIPLPSIYTRINDFEKQIVDIELEQSLLKEVEESLKDKDIDIYKLIAIIAGSQFENNISAYLSSLQELLLKKEQYLYDVTKNSSQIKSLNYQIDIQKKLLQEIIVTLKTNLETKKSKLNKLLTDYESIAQVGPKAKYNVYEYSRLQRMYNISVQFYNKLAEKKAEYQISKAGYVSEIVLLEKPYIPKDSISPRRRLIYFGSIIAALIISLGLILVRYLFYNEITNINDVIKYTDAPILGIIPKYKKDIPVSQLIVDHKPKSLIAEALRSVRTNLQFINNDPGTKVIAITSSISGEGKTFVSLNLAGIMAFSEKKVIVMDFDLRKPKIHIGFKVENKKGISTILMGLNKIDECIQHSSVDYLDFITAGPVPPNPAELMLNPRMPELINYLKAKYDYIVIDNPPIGIVTDGMKSMLLADYPIYVFKAGHSKRVFVQNVDRLIKESNLKKLAIVLNAVEPQYSAGNYGKGSTYGQGGYGYGYGYGYTYGYGYYDEDHLMPVKKKFFLDRISNYILKKLFNIN